MLLTTETLVVEKPEEDEARPRPATATATVTDPALTQRAESSPDDSARSSCPFARLGGQGMRCCIGETLRTRRCNTTRAQDLPGVGTVTDELVLGRPDAWDLADVAELLESAGGTKVSVTAGSEAALVDQPTRYVAGRPRPCSTSRVVRRGRRGALRRRARQPVGERAAVQDVLDLTVRDVHVQIRRLAPFTRHRARPRRSSLADLVDDVLVPAARRLVAQGRGIDVDGDPDVRRRTSTASARVVDGAVVGRATARSDEGQRVPARRHAWAPRARRRKVRGL